MKNGVKPIITNKRGVGRWGEIGRTKKFGVVVDVLSLLLLPIPLLF